MMHHWNKLANGAVYKSQLWFPSGHLRWSALWRITHTDKLWYNPKNQSGHVRWSALFFIFHCMGSIVSSSCLCESAGSLPRSPIIYNPGFNLPRVECLNCCKKLGFWCIQWLHVCHTTQCSLGLVAPTNLNQNGTGHKKIRLCLAMPSHSNIPCGYKTH